MPTERIESSRRVLVVGAGAVGRVFGRCLQRGGARTGFLVKPEHVPEVQEGFTLYRMRRFRRPGRERLENFELYTEAAEAARHRWDQIWLAVPSTALPRPGFAETLATLRAGEPPTLVVLQPALDDARLLSEHWPPDRMVRGVIALLSWSGPLVDEIPEPATAYWRPAPVSLPFTGPTERTRAVLASLRAGGWPAQEDPRLPQRTARGSAVMMCVLMALEAEGWSFKGLTRGTRLRRACEAAREAMVAVDAFDGCGHPGWERLLTPATIRTLIATTRAYAPLPLETYLARHFTKVADQTHEMVRTYVRLARRAGGETSAMEELLDAVAAEDEAVSLRRSA